MRSKELLLAVKKEIEEKSSAIFIKTPLKVFIHNVPLQAVSEEMVNYPFVIIRLSEKEIEEHYTQDTLILALGIYEPNNTEKAGLDLAELQDMLTRLFYENRIVGDFFDVLLPIKASQIEPDRKWHEYHISSLEITFQYNSLPLRPLGEVFAFEETTISPII